MEKPRDFGEKGNEFWEEVTSEFELSRAELRILEDACSEIQIIDELMNVWIREGRPTISLGSMKQETENALLISMRQHRQVLRQLLAALRLPDDEEDEQRDRPMSRTESARKAAQARWRRQRGLHRGAAS